MKRNKKWINVLILTVLVFSQLQVNIVFALTDNTAPEFAGIEVDKKEVTGGESVKVSVEASDGESGIHTVEVVYKYASTQDAHGLNLNYNPLTGKYEGMIDVNGQNLNLNGNWIVYYVSITDNSGNTLKVQSGQQDLSSGDINVSGNDVTPPVFSSVEVDKREVSTGENLVVTVDASDSGSGVKEVLVEYENEDRVTFKQLQLQFNESINKYEGIFEIDENIVGGHWFVSRITIYDNNENVIYLNNKEAQPYDPWAIDLSSGDFNVVDHAPPIVTGVSPDGYYNRDVTIEFNEGTGYLSGETSGGSIWSGEVVTKEGNYTVVVTDQAGNETAINFTIDKTAPIVSGIYSNGLYNYDVAPTFNEGTATLNGEPFDSGTTISEEGNYILQVTDRAGFETTVHFMIDKTAPTVTGVDPDVFYLTNVMPVFSEGTAVLDGKPFNSGTNVIEEGRHILIVSDEAGNSTIIVFTIDRSAPQVWGVIQDGVYNTNVSINFSEGTATLNGVPYINGTVIYDEGTYTLTVADSLGNQTTINFKIDKAPPVVSGVKNDAIYKTDITPTFNEGTAILNGNAFTSGTSIEEEGAYQLIVTDKAGNKTTVEFTIDKTDPAILSIDEVTDQSTFVAGITEAGAIVNVKIGPFVLNTVTADQDGNFKAEIPAQNAETTLTVTAADSAGNTSRETEVKVKSTVVQEPFSDVFKYVEEINFLTGKRIINGYPDGTFRPEQPIKRIQAVQMILREMGIDPVDSPNPGLKDMVPGSYGYEEVAAAVELGFISGKDDGTFDPFGTLTRGQMAKILVKAYELSGTYDKNFSDVTKEHWTYEYVSALAYQNITTGYGDNTFRPNEKISRQHFSLFMARYLDNRFK